jgi:antitoxin ParD1/3/4
MLGRMSITITLTDDQEAWLAAQVDAGAFPSIEAAARQVIDERMAEDAVDIDDDDLAWAKPLVDEGIAQFERGEYVTQEEYEPRTTARLAALGVKWP